MEDALRSLHRRPALFEAITKDLVGRDASKGIIRFGLDEPVPESVVERLATWGAADAARVAPRVQKKVKKQQQKDAKNKQARKKPSLRASNLVPRGKKA